MLLNEPPSIHQDRRQGGGRRFRRICSIVLHLTCVSQDTFPPRFVLMIQYYHQFNVALQPPQASFIRAVAACAWAFPTGCCFLRLVALCQRVFPACLFIDPIFSTLPDSRKTTGTGKTTDNRECKNTVRIIVFNFTLEACDDRFWVLPQKIVIGEQSSCCVPTKRHPKTVSVSVKSSGTSCPLCGLALVQNSSWPLHSCFKSSCSGALTGRDGDYLCLAYFSL